MADALFTLGGDSSEFRSVLGLVLRDSRRTALAIQGDWRRIAAEANRTQREIANGATRSAAAVRSANDRTAQAAQAGQRAQTNATKAGVEERVRATESGVSRQVRAIDRIRAVWASVERANTAATLREEQARIRARERAGQQARSNGASNGRAAVGVVSGAAQNAHGQIQDARQRRAGTEHTLNSAFYQAGISGAEAAGMRAQILREVATGRLRGLESNDVASAISAAQTQFSVLSQTDEQRRSGMTAESSRQENLNNALSAIEFARNTYQDPGEVLRVVGMLNQQGVRGDQQREVLRSLTGIAQAGSIELRDVIGQALGPLMQNISVATGRLGSNATEADRSRAVREAAARTLAVGEVAAAAGPTARDALNGYAKLQRSFSSDRVTQNLYETLHERGASGRAVASELFESTINDRGQQVHRLRNNDPLQVMSRLMQWAGGDTTRVLNMLQGGGRGDPQIVDSQVRRFVSALQSQSGSGTMADRVQSLVQQGSSFTAADEARGASMRNAEQLTALTTNNEVRDAALTENTGALGQLSDRFTSWAASNPLANVALGAAAPGVLGWLGGKIGGITGGLVGGGGAAGGAAGGGAVAGAGGGIAARVASMLGLGGAAFGLTGAALANQNEEANRTTGTTFMQRARAFFGGTEEELGASVEARRANATAQTNERNDARGWRPSALGMSGAETERPLRVDLTPQSANVLMQAIRSAPALTLRLDPHDAAHQNAMASGSRAREQ